MSKRNLVAQHLRDALSYDPDTGFFTWKFRVNKIGRAVKSIGKQAGAVDFYGRTVIRFHGHLYFAHQLVWLYVHDRWPQHVIDHINGDPSDNRIANLRDVPQTVNMQNRRKPKKNNHLALLGVSSLQGSSKLRARIVVAGKEKYLGLFDTAEEAHQAYVKAKREKHPGCTI